MRRRVSVLGLVAGLPDFALGLTYLLVWIGSAWPPISLRHLLGLLLLEGVIVNSAGFMSYVLVGGESRGFRALSVLGIGAAFAGLVWLVAERLDQPWFLVAFVAMTLNRMLGVLIGQAPRESEREFVIVSWVGGLMLFTSCVFASYLISVPTLGVVRWHAVHEGLPLLGSWTAEPSRFLACGFVYFTLLGLSQMTDFTWVSRLVHSTGQLVLGLRRT